ncbi:MAG: HDOD domain-containing protein [Phycisphaerales bacterium JB043]
MTMILIADDSSVIREPIAIALRAVGFETTQACDGNEALSLMRHRTPDLVLLDIRMPNLDGLQTLRFMREDPKTKQVPVMLLTDAREKEVFVQARDLSVCGALLKSEFTLDELISRVNRILGTNSQIIETTGPIADSTGAGGSASASSGSGPETDSAHESDVIQENQDEQLKRLKPVLGRTELCDLLEECGELKAMSPTAAEVLRLSNNSSATVDLISKAIRRDQAIALKILKMANSSAYGTGEPVDSVDKAVVRIGMKAIGQAVMNISVVDSFKSTGSDSELDPLLFWEHSIGCGIIAAILAETLKCVEPDSAFTMGLVHDVGRLVYYDMLGDKYAEVLSTAKSQQLPLDLVEKRLLLLNHADGMDRVLRRWNFPNELIDPIVLHHLSIGNIRRMAPKRLSEVGVLALANRLAHALLLGSSGNDTIYSTLEFCEALGVQPRTISDIESRVPDETRDLKFAMLNAGVDASWPDLQQAARDEIGADFRPLFVSPSPELDAFRIVCEQLTTCSEGPPNCGVVHISNARETLRVLGDFKKQEADLVGAAVPLIILSPSTKIYPKETELEGRTHRHVLTPFTVPRFTSTVSELLRTRITAQAA